jgi:hypothetical protein
VTGKEEPVLKCHGSRVNMGYAFAYKERNLPKGDVLTGRKRFKSFIDIDSRSIGTALKHALSFQPCPCFPKTMPTD